ncbi:hypothetical protein NDU88_003925 [Pleurodeles waltl]|uniref:Uncharacterized protein n=1 Tax=Pleurodeles waltl TaxID=8319 RepID=A0AAV7TPZ7_PLEWA|nr:hypothetical protein NDU88_003925 [Pleurodeles waltl]
MSLENDCLRHHLLIPDPVLKTTRMDGKASVSTVQYSRIHFVCALGEECALFRLVWCFLPTADARIKRARAGGENVEMSWSLRERQAKTPGEFLLLFSPIYGYLFPDP